MERSSSAPGAPRQPQQQQPQKQKSWTMFKWIQLTMVIAVVVFSFATYMMYEMLTPILLNSTSEIAGINNPTDGVRVAEQIIENTLFHQNEPVHQHHKPKPQFSVKYRTTTNPAVKDLEPRYRASTAMSVKFR